MLTTGRFFKLTPRHLPSLRDMLADLGHPPKSTVARALGVSVRSLERWTAQNHAPRSAALALFWLTSYGRGTLDADLENGATLARALASQLMDENQRLRRELARVAALADFDSANDPIAPGADVPAQPARLRSVS